MLFKLNKIVLTVNHSATCEAAKSSGSRKSKPACLVLCKPIDLTKLSFSQTSLLELEECCKAHRNKRCDANQSS